MNYNNGEITKTVGGQSRTFKFGLNTLRFLADRHSQEKLETSALELISHILWAALMVRQSINNLPDNFSVEDMCDWMDELGAEETAELWKEARKSMGFIPNVLLLASPEDQQPEV